MPVLWNATNADPAEFPLGTASAGAAYHLSDGGWIAGEAGGKAVYWTVNAEGTIAGPIDLPLPTNHVKGVALGTDSEGRFVGESEAANGTVHGVFWARNQAGDFVVTDLGPASAQAINDGTRIAGYGGADSAARRRSGTPVRPARPTSTPCSTPTSSARPTA